MRVLMLEAPERLLEERRRRGLDHHDGMWQGVLHMVPSPSSWHQGFGGELFVVLAPIAKARGLMSFFELSLYLANDDYRTPDLVFAHPRNVTKRGIQGGAELIVETLSPNDESYEKLPFYEELGVREALYVNPETRVFEPFARKKGRLVKVPKDKTGHVASRTLGVAFATRKGPRLEVSWPGEKTTV